MCMTRVYYNNLYLYSSRLLEIYFHENGVQVWDLFVCAGLDSRTRVGPLTLKV